MYIGNKYLSKIPFKIILNIGENDYMNNIIKALVVALYQHESWGADTIDDNTSSDALAEIAGILKNATPEEVLHLEHSLSKLASSTTDPVFSNYCNDFVDLFINKYNEYW